MDSFAANGFIPRLTIPLTMYSTAASGCSVLADSLPFLERNLDQSVSDGLEVDARFRAGCFAEGDDAGFIGTLCMYD